MINCSYYQDDILLDGNICDLEKSLRVNCAGYAVRDQEYGRSQVRQDFYLQLVDTGTMLLGQEKVPFSESHFIIHSPQTEVTYIFNDEPLSYYWIHFTGKDARKILEETGLRCDRIYKISERGMNKAIQAFQAIFDEFMLRRPSYASMLSADCHALLVQLYRGAEEAEQGYLRNRFDGCIRFIHNNSAENISIAMLAKQEMLSVSHFRALFREAFGCSPYEYLMKVRMNKATSYLLESNMRIGEIAALCGFSDQLYFSRLFARRYGISPTAYRNKYR
jgi:AraC-like DNA-binding protein